MTEAISQTVLAAVISAIRRVTRLDNTPISPATRFSEDLSLDSLDVIEITMALEEIFETEFPTDARHRFRSVSDLAEYVSRHYFRDIPEPDSE